MKLYVDLTWLGTKIDGDWKFEYDFEFKINKFMSKKIAVVIFGYTC